MDVQSFSSWDDMQAAMQQAEDIANERLSALQRTIRDRMDATVHWVRPVPDMGLVVYGVAPSIPEGDVDAVTMRMRGYLTGAAFSIWEPEGEIGDTHVADVVPISGRVFDMAKAAGWPSFDTLAEHQELARMLACAESANIDSRQG